ncbi:MAG: D-glycero-beta-D-manno-heptose 1-phosphate adenylyltransferase [Lentimicrobiaceae bacterium]|nr:D-glycero-beta-D-manno-heptose 1-phosphate adenylyltransferase [Lentimicrobiaceae bacterium]
MKDNLTQIIDKIWHYSDYQRVQDVISQARSRNEKIIFTNGCFDIVHRGHVEYLCKAKDIGGFLVVGLNTDASVRKIKGPNRPLQDEVSRAKVLASLFFVDLVILFDEETPIKLIDLIIPDILVKGNDYKPEEIVGYDTVVNNGGVVKTIPLVEGYSTTSIVNKMNKI